MFCSVWSFIPFDRSESYAIPLEEIRAGLNADFAEVMAARERADEFRFWSWRTAMERQKERTN